MQFDCVARRWIPYSFLLYYVLFLEIIKANSSPWNGQMGWSAWKGQGCRDPSSGCHEQRRKLLRKWRQWQLKSCEVCCEETLVAKQAAQKNEKKLDKAYKKKLTKRAKERILPRTEVEENSDHQPPNEFPNGLWKSRHLSLSYLRLLMGAP